MLRPVGRAAKSGIGNITTLSSDRDDSAELDATTVFDQERLDGGARGVTGEALPPAADPSSTTSSPTATALPGGGEAETETGGEGEGQHRVADRCGRVPTGRESAIGSCRR